MLKLLATLYFCATNGYDLYCTTTRSGFGKILRELRKLEALTLVLSNEYEKPEDVTNKTIYQTSTEPGDAALSRRGLAGEE